eukprot:SAG11_NODE_2120_length_3790_cov_6.378759_2_plen_108_part_00
MHAFESAELAWVAVHQLPCGVEVILGCNGYIWLAPPQSNTAIDAGAEPRTAPQAAAEVPLAVREALCRVRCVAPTCRNDDIEMIWLASAARHEPRATVATELLYDMF